MRSLERSSTFIGRLRRATRRLLVLLLATWLTTTQAGVQPQEVAPGVWFVQGESALGSGANRNFISNAGFVVTPAGVVVIDALGAPVLAEELIDAIRRVTLQPIRYVIVTHYHADHVYGLQAFQAVGARILAHPAARLYLNAELAQQRLRASREELAPWIDEKTRLVEADQWLQGEQTELDLGGQRLFIRHAGPAHTPEDLVVYHPASGSLFTGDLVFRARIPFVGQADSRAWIRALDGLLAWAPRRLLPGHGPVAEQPLQDLQLTRDYLQYLRDTMGIAARELEPFETAYARTDWSRFAKLPLFGVANRINAYNTYLLMEREATP
ncbi:MBL fold metallo-hydrolase [Inhella sp.]|uniref:MBL fold metallo-hydrolase n=1 Tax=Inhella sp. TaxID=1921806 RepID=UPI0035AE239B